MKWSLISIATFCISLSNLPAWAETLQPDMVQPPIPQSTAQPADGAAVEPAALTTQGGAADLTVEERSPSAPLSDRTETLNGTAAQINQNLAAPPEEPSPLRFAGEALSLPEGMVIRGGSRGALSIGSELPQ